MSIVGLKKKTRTGSNNYPDFELNINHQALKQRVGLWGAGDIVAHTCPKPANPSLVPK